MPHFEKFLNGILHNEIFSESDMEECIGYLMEGRASPNQMGLFLSSLARRGETAAEIAGAARALRKYASTITTPEGAIDCCGTGGDGLQTYNISTAVALVSAACGVPVAKHGNRAASSKSGAADVLEKLGVNLSPPREKLEEALNTIGFCFLMAPNHHAAMKHVAPVRKMLGMRTIFNLLGPLANPAGTKKQLIGVYAEKWLKPMAEALKSLDSEKVMIVHGDDGLDEISLTGRTHAVLLENGQITPKIFTPEIFGLSPVKLHELAGGDPEHNAAALRDLLQGGKSGYRDMILANTAAVLSLHDHRDLKQGVKDAAEALDSGCALGILEQYKALVA